MLSLMLFTPPTSRCTISPLFEDPPVKIAMGVAGVGSSLLQEKEEAVAMKYFSFGGISI
jgi:hypothetical protein